jgi:hypothetical protein
LLKEYPSVLDVFCGTETVIHMKSTNDMLEADALKEALVKLEVVCEGVERDDTAVL